MSNDTLRDLSQNPLVQRLGVPRIPVLRRHVPGAPLLDGPALVGTVGEGTYADAVRALLENESVAEAGGGDVTGGKVAGVVLDATAARTLDDLAAAQEFLTPAVRRLAANGRLLVLAPEPGEDPEAAAVAQAFDGIVRSAAKEVRAGATANLLVVHPDAPPAALDSSVRFLLSGRSAYVDGQVVHVGVPVGPEQDPIGMDAPAEPVAPLAGRVAVVTGAARGIGAAIADTLARDGAVVVAVDVPAAGEALAAVANRTGGTALQLDITAADAAERLLAHLRERHGRVDVVVHNAGITRDKLLANMDADRWNAVLAVNLRAQLGINRALLEGDLLSDSGRIVCVASTSGIAGNRGQTNYAASKAGVIGMVRALAPRAAARGVTVNAVAPGFIETEMTARMPLGTREGGRRINSLRQGGLPVDVAETVGWLGQAESGGVTGQVVRVCGQSMIGA
ncbi:3-oxoacyl-ACP reductase [Pseudonocardia sp. KRD-184]|uniref:3-oxoacyl-ACP reductase n=1 Tax=Pseudonocardia oceani TaxID=2792013 RepID=A0ABS6UAT0_9PSEU|nr:3-oxoacyl-ACP reductase [Pseudonocardia oceani]MBW0091655.1 3-oxoacyl-ACP reductase [Pseudonocardia oceani]MBW0094752.1 3-oxoacyl-ACP reductase [Pseudonocardia oceani]MBW0111285.1 3-oxoacyl-ACP reductase [Pseudonocardia oceani]MBW0120260.1 3-oxoacyl-ACP reductase [Pseudonocardia oceani]MBW0128984.1 3-oxoacyl-ACP reductase [Pseudonocardia oceani]